MDLKEGARQLGVELNEEQLAGFERYRSELLAWNQRFNLTAIENPEDVTTKHFLDSLSCLSALLTVDDRPVNEWFSLPLTMVDVGSGAGFPGLPLKIAWPELRLTLLEATGKKCRFLEHMAETLDLSKVAVVNARAEDYGQGSGREVYDLAVARAVSKLPAL